MRPIIQHVNEIGFALKIDERLKSNANLNSQFMQIETIRKTTASLNKILIAIL